MKHKKLVVSFFIMFFMLSLVGGWNLYQLALSPLVNQNEQPLIINLDKTISAHQFVRILKNKQLISCGNCFLWLIRFENLSHRLKAGVYQIRPGETAIQLLHKVVNGDVIIEKFSIIEGTTQKKVIQDLRLASYLDNDVNAWTTISQGHSNAEGLLLADTYQYRGGSSSKSLLEHAHKNLVTYLNESWKSRLPELPYLTPYDLLIAASIIEKESAIAQERKLISGVVMNRLKKKMPLQMDPTVIYGLGNQYNGKLIHDDLLIDTPYNTYKNKGLPPTPIAMVGKEAIDAAAHPQLSQYLYYVAKGDGSHQFSETYEQQKNAINQFRRRNH